MDFVDILVDIFIFLGMLQAIGVCVGVVLALILSPGHKPGYKPMQKPIQKPMQRPIQKPTQKLMQQPIQKSVTDSNKADAYLRDTGNSRLSVLFNKGKTGEYYTYLYLKDIPIENKRFLFNVYVPYGKNGATTEIDVIMLCQKGIFVFESKNYSGWIYGNAGKDKWYQTLKSRYGIIKNEFYNPIMQNDSHITVLRNYLGCDVPYYSVVVFSERCTLKSIDVFREDVRVIKRNYLYPAVFDLYNRTPRMVFTLSDIDEIYNILYPLSQQNGEVRKNHIDNIRSVHK